MTKKPTLMPAVAAIQPPRSKPVTLTEQAREATHLMQQETTRLQHRYHGPEHLLYGLLRDASDPAGIDLYPNERREHAYLGLPSVAPSVRLLIEAHGAALETLLEAVRGELDQNTTPPVTET